MTNKQAANTLHALLASEHLLPRDREALTHAVGVLQTLDLKEKALDVLGAILRRMRSDQQGGYPSLHRGKWSFVSTGLPQTSPKELNVLFAGCGIVPDEIKSNGSCETCINARITDDGERVERGYAAPCSGCLRPKMSNYLPVVP
jgi:hypothetical protein